MGDSDIANSVVFDEKTGRKFKYKKLYDYIDQFVDEDNLEKLRRKLPKGASAKDGFDKFSEEKKLDEFETRIASYAIEERHIGMDYGASSNRVSLKYFEEEEEFDGDFAIFPRGFSQITAGLAKGLDIRLSTPVKNIDYSGDGVIVTSENQAFKGKQVVVTAS